MMYAVTINPETRMVKLIRAHGPKTGKVIRQWSTNGNGITEMFRLRDRYNYRYARRFGKQTTKTVRAPRMAWHWTGRAA